VAAAREVYVKLMVRARSCERMQALMERAKVWSLRLRQHEFPPLASAMDDDGSANFLWLLCCC
jgi:hypothetical protein